MRIPDYPTASTDGLIREAARLATIIPLMRAERKSKLNISSVHKKLNAALRELRARECEPQHAVVSVPASVESVRGLCAKYGR